MTDPHGNDPRGDPPSEPDERELAQVAVQLSERRPIPVWAFREGLRRRLVSDLGAPPMPPRSGVLALACFASGLLLLAFAALGLTGSGPFAA